MSWSICIDLKSFYASVECVERGLNPLTTDLVVADESRTNGTVCLAVSPSLKAKGIKNRCRLFEVPRTKNLIIAPPRMKKYIDYCTEIYGIYLNHFSKEDLFQYSIDECFINVQPYLKMYQKSASALAEMLMKKIQKKLGLRATAGVGTNLYLAKVALDIMAKTSPNFIGELTEKTYREKLWDYRPLSDFWRIGRKTAEKLENHAILTQRAITLADPELLYKLFGIDAELLIDHAWGIEPVTIKDIKQHQPKSRSFSEGQVLPREYSREETALIIREMSRELAMRLIKTHMTAEIISLSIGTKDFQFHSGSIHLSGPTNNLPEIVTTTEQVFWRVTDPNQKIRRINLSAGKIADEQTIKQLDLFTDTELKKREHKKSEAILAIKSRFGKNAIFQAEDLEPHAQTLARNREIGGHKSGEN